MATLAARDRQHRAPSLGSSASRSASSPLQPVPWWSPFGRRCKLTWMARGAFLQRGTPPLHRRWPQSSPRRESELHPSPGGGVAMSGARQYGGNGARSSRHPASRALASCTSSESKSCLEDTCPCQPYASSCPLRSDCSSWTSCLSSLRGLGRRRLRGSARSPPECPTRPITSPATAAFSNAALSSQMDWTRSASRQAIAWRHWPETAIGMYRLRQQLQPAV